MITPTKLQTNDISNTIYSYLDLLVMIRYKLHHEDHEIALLQCYYKVMHHTSDNVWIKLTTVDLIRFTEMFNML